MSPRKKLRAAPDPNAAPDPDLRERRRRRKRQVRRGRRCHRAMNSQVARLVRRMPQDHSGKLREGADVSAGWPEGLPPESGSMHDRQTANDVRSDTNRPHTKPAPGSLGAHLAALREEA